MKLVYRYLENVRSSTHIDESETSSWQIDNVCSVIYLLPNYICLHYITCTYPEVNRIKSHIIIMYEKIKRN